MARRLDFTLSSVIFTRGNDGFLRGHPEPWLLMAVYSLVPHTVLVKTMPFAPSVKGPYPFTEQLDVKLRMKLAVETSRLALLTVGLEMDSGRDIDAITTDLAAVPELTARRGDSPLAVPFRLAELHHVSWAGPPAGEPVLLARAGRELAASCVADDWVGARLLVVGPGTSCPCEQRLVSDDGRNDWTVKFHLRF